MWPFRKKSSLIESGILNGYTDYHSHLLPGVDDGVQTMKDSLNALDRFEAWGVESLWLTPHIMEDMPNRTEHLRQQFAELQTAYTGKIQLHLAAEYMMDNLFNERLRNKDLLPLGENGKHLLVETSYFNPPVNLYSVLEQIKQQGYHPVLAHPERYVYMGPEEYQKLKDLHIKFQLNLTSLSGAYGEKVQKKAIHLIKEGMYEVSGSDVHSIHSFSKTASWRAYCNSLYSRLASKQGQALQI